MNDLDKTINAENKRVSYEWDAFQKQYGGGDYKTLSQKAKDESLYQVQKQQYPDCKMIIEKDCIAKQKLYNLRKH
jgi:hypothetical protein